MGDIFVGENGASNKGYISFKDIMRFIVRLISISAISFIYVEGMLKLTIINPGAPLSIGVLRGILLFLHYDFHFHIVRDYFQNDFTFFNKIGILSAVLSWIMSWVFVLLVNFNK